jgi:hypothetical protein
MPKPKTLSDLTAASVRPQASRREYPDAALPGLYLVVQPSGVKSWAYRTRVDRRPVKITLGRFDQKAFGVTAARDAARTALEAAQSGALQRTARAPLLLAAPVAAAPLALPAPASPDEPAPGTVGAVWADYLRLHLEPTAPASVKKYTSSMKRVLPLWNDRPVAEISRKDVMEVTDAALARGPEARNTTIVALSSFFNWCLSRDLVAASPVTVKKTKQEDRDRVLTDGEVRVFWKGCADLGPIFGPMFQLLLLTGCRRDEVAGMQWAEVNGKVWSIPGSRTKNGQPLDVALVAPLALTRSSPLRRSRSTLRLIHARPSLTWAVHNRLRLAACSTWSRLACCRCALHPGQSRQTGKAGHRGRAKFFGISFFFIFLNSASNCGK